MSRYHIKKIKGGSLNVILFGILLQSSAFAEERQGVLVNTGLTLLNDSNITRTEEKVPDNVGIFSPQLQFLSKVRKHTFVLRYHGDFVAYKDNTQYNYNDHDIELNAEFNHSYRINSEFSLRYQDQVEEPGSNDAQSLLGNEFNEFTRRSAVAKIYYGNIASTGQLVIGVDHDQQRYTNNQQSFRDLDLNKLTGTFFYRVAPKTRLLLEASIAQIDYVEDTVFAAPNSDENLYLTGVEWEATAITSGTFKVGYQKKDFENNQFDDLDGLSYFLDMSWLPNTFTKVKIGAERSTSESAEQDIGGFITTGYSLALEHSLTGRTHLNARYQHNELDFRNLQNRADSRKNIVIGITHSTRTWLEISLHYRHLARSSNDDIYAFTSNALELSLTGTFD